MQGNYGRTMSTIQERQKKNEKLLKELKATKLIVRYNQYRLKLLYKNDRTFFENLFLEYAISTKKLEKILKNKN